MVWDHQRGSQDGRRMACRRLSLRYREVQGRLRLNMLHCQSRPRALQSLPLPIHEGRRRVPS